MSHGSAYSPPWPGRIGHRGGEGTALLAALGQPPLAKLEAETGAKLIQKVGRGIRLTEAGQMLAERATEIIGRIDSAAAELSAHVGLRAGRVRLAAFPSALGTFVPGAAALLAREHPGLELRLTETEPPDALRMLRAGYVDVAVIFRYDDTDPEDDGIRLTHLLDDPSYLVTAGRTGDSVLTGTPGGSGVANGAGATCSTSAPTWASNRRSPSPPTTSSSRPWSPPGWG